MVTEASAATLKSRRATLREVGIDIETNARDATSWAKSVILGTHGHTRVSLTLVGGGERCARIAALAGQKHSETHNSQSAAACRLELPPRNVELGVALDESLASGRCAAMHR